MQLCGLLVEEFGVKDFYTFNVSYKRQGVKLERERRGASQIWGGCCLKQFAGFGGIFGIAAERLMVGGGSFLRRGKGGLSEAGFAGFWEIFGIAGERLMVGRRVFFAAGERADCGGAIIGDAPMYASLAPSWH